MGEIKFQDKYRIASARLASYDYGSSGAYFITICTKDREHYFGDVAIINDEPVIQPTLVGQRVIDGWLSIPAFSPFVELDVFQLMPNHLHGVLLSINRIIQLGSQTHLAHKVKTWRLFCAVSNQA